MTAITNKICEVVLNEVRKTAKDAAIRKQSFFCKRQKRKVTPAQCSDCFDAMPYTVRFKYHEKRKNCIKANKEEPVKEDPSPPVSNQPLPVGAEVEIKEKGQEPIRVQITKEMTADYDAALKLVTQAAQDETRAQILKTVGVALYAGDSVNSRQSYETTSTVHHSAQPDTQKRNLWHCPWVIDGYSSFEEACRETFGLNRRAAYYHAAIGKALIAQYGKENVVAKTEELGIAQIPQYKLREILKAPEFFEQLCARGYAVLPSGEEVTIGTVLETGIAELPSLINRFVETPPALPGAGKKKPKDAFKNWNDKGNPLTQAPLVQKEQLIAENLQYLINEAKRLNKKAQEIIEGWPEETAAIFGASTRLQEMLDDFLYPLAFIGSALGDPHVPPWDPKEVKNKLQGKSKD